MRWISVSGRDQALSTPEATILKLQAVALAGVASQIILAIRHHYLCNYDSKFCFNYHYYYTVN